MLLLVKNAIITVKIYPHFIGIMNRVFGKIGRPKMLALSGCFTHAKTKIGFSGFGMNRLYLNVFSINNINRNTPLDKAGRWSKKTDQTRH
ncbi:hypothetical protein A6J60_007690 [Psychrobacter sp. FDAARGOS_221]|nr:hypothetical protein A6J60_007690 [Psychrobacter sp. FDAARGOS_221]